MDSYSPAKGANEVKLVSQQRNLPLLREDCDQTMRVDGDQNQRENFCAM